MKANSELDPDERRQVLEVLREEGPLSHEELADELDYSWDHVQKIIRELRTEGLVTITLDRRYEFKHKPGSVAA